MELRELNGIPDEVFENTELLELILPVLRADIRMCESYVCRSNRRLAQPLSVFGGEDDASVPTADLHAWSQLTTGSCSISMLPGGHFFIHESGEAFLKTFNGHLAAVARSVALR